VRNLASFLTSLNFELPAYGNAAKQGIRTLKPKYSAAMIVLCLSQVWWSWVHTPLITVCQKCPIPKNCTVKTCYR